MRFHRAQEFACPTRPWSECTFSAPIRNSVTSVAHFSFGRAAVKSRFSRLGATIPVSPFHELYLRFCLTLQTRSRPPDQPADQGGPLASDDRKCRPGHPDDLLQHLKRVFCNIGDEMPCSSASCPGVDSPEPHVVNPSLLTEVSHRPPPDPRARRNGSDNELRGCIKLLPRNRN